MRAGDPLRRLIDTSSSLRRIVKSRRGQSLVQATRGARVVSQGSRFAWAELRGSSQRSAYRLRSGPRVVVRHGTRDVHMVNEIFGATGGHRAYELPPALEPLPPAPRVLDLGGNIGLFALFAFSEWNARSVTSFEPDPHNLVVLDAAFDENPAYQAGWTRVRSAASNVDTTWRFDAGHESESRRSDGDSDSTITVDVADVLRGDVSVDLAKIDIEGGEWAILADERFRDFGADRVVLEWHRYLCDTDAPRERVRELLESGGYTVRAEFPGPTGSTGVVWAQR